MIEVVLKIYSRYTVGTVHIKLPGFKIGTNIFGAKIKGFPRKICEMTLTHGNGQQHCSTKDLSVDQRYNTKGIKQTPFIYITDDVSIGNY